MENFILNMLGPLSLADYVAGMIFALLGVIISLRLDANTRDRLSPRTPSKFSWRFLILDNLQRLITGFIITFVSFRFAPEILKTDFSMFAAFMVGFAFDKIIELIKRAENLARK